MSEQQTICFDQVCGKREKCCHSLDLGVAYCCSEFTEFVYIGLMIGGGVIIALLIVICYLCMRRAERSLEEAARLDAVKSLSNSTVSSPNNSGGGGNEANDASCSVSTTCEDLNRPPPSYDQVVSPDHIRRYQSFDPQIMLTSTGNSYDVTPTLGLQLGESYRNSYQSTSAQDPPLAKYVHGLPSLPPVTDSEDKLPTYFEYTGLVSHNVCNNHSPTGSSELMPPDAEHSSMGESDRTTYDDRGKDKCSQEMDTDRPTGVELSQSSNTCPAPLQLSVPTQVDDGMGIVTSSMTDNSCSSFTSGENENRIVVFTPPFSTEAFHQDSSITSGDSQNSEEQIEAADENSCCSSISEKPSQSDTPSENKKRAEDGNEVEVEQNKK